MRMKNIDMCLRKEKTGDKIEEKIKTKNIICRKIQKIDKNRDKKPTKKQRKPQKWRPGEANVASHSVRANKRSKTCENGQVLYWITCRLTLL